MAFTWSDSRIESIIKLLGAFVVLLYVIGLIISNLHFMELGIADFPTLNPQNAMTGVLFLIWLALLTALVAPPAFSVLAAVYIAGSERPIRSRALRLIGVIAGGFVMTAIFAWQISGFCGFLLPWGNPWQSSFSAQGWSYIAEAQSFNQLGELFWYPKVITGSAFLFALLTYLFHRYLSTTGRSQLGIQKADGKLVAWYVKLIQGILVVSPIGLILLFSSFAQDIFPNIKSNVGGRQPQIAALDLRVIDTPSLAASTEAVAIWHQSEKFLYVMPLTGPILNQDNGAPPLIAIDITLVKTIQHVRKYARIRNGSRITFVGDMPAR